MSNSFSFIKWAKEFASESLFEVENSKDIENIYVNKDKKTIVVVFHDGTKSIVKCAKGDTFNIYSGVAIAIVKACYGKGRFEKALENKIQYSRKEKKNETK